MALQLPELLDGVDFAVPERGKRLHIGFGEDERQIVLPQHRRAEDLAADGDALAGQRGDVVFDDVHQTVKQLFLHRVAPVSLRMARDHVVPFSSLADPRRREKAGPCPAGTGVISAVLPQKLCLSTARSYGARFVQPFLPSPFHLP